MKYITFAVPCYNSESYMDRCVETLLTGGNRVEIVLVDDGSSDRTAEIADRYHEKYPDIIKVVHQPNSGHGEGVNQGLRNATGKYFKVVDSDDWLDTRALRRLLDYLEYWDNRGEQVDLVVCNYIYDHLYENSRHTVKFRSAFRPGEICTWDDMGFFDPSQYMIMHALIYRTEVLRKSGLKLPKHTFYVDNIVAYQPLPYVEKLCYLDLDLYHYFIGREGQSVNESVMMKRIDQQLKVTKIIMDCVDLSTVKVPFHHAGSVLHSSADDRRFPRHEEAPCHVALSGTEGPGSLPPDAPLCGRIHLPALQARQPALAGWLSPCQKSCEIPVNPKEVTQLCRTPLLHARQWWSELALPALSPPGNWLTTDTRSRSWNAGPRSAAICMTIPGTGS